ncbi:MAG: D-alanyl-D-alanine carboxypeptidase/D-alanyl-D-alanine-endopeptidase [Ignavibacteriaceae bacterium]
MQDRFNFVKSIKFLLALFFVITSASAQNKTKIENQLLKLSKSDALKHGQWGVYAEYVDSGKEIFSLNSDYSLAPASGLKVFTTSAALNILGEDFIFETKLYYWGNINSDGTLKGNIFIKGGGDPTLGSNLVKGSLAIDSLMNVWVNSIKKIGIKKVEGSIISDASLFEGNSVPDYWPYIDIGNYYGAGISALCINDNLYHLYFTPSKDVGGEAKVLKVVPEIEGLTFTNFMRTGSKGSGDNGYIYSAPNQFQSFLRGTIPAGVDEFSIRGSIPNPPLFAAQYLKSFLEKNDIKVSSFAKVADEKISYDEAKLILKTISPPVKDIVYIINKKSFNLYAEQLLAAIGLKLEGKGSTYSGIKALKIFLDSNGIPTDGLELYDGSGLSRTNTITPKIMVKLLSFMTKQKTFHSFYNSLGIAGDPNDISFYKNMGANTKAANNARIKSGLINGVRSHSGYVEDLKGRMIAFSFIANNFSGTTSDINKLHEKLLILLSELQ